jgi:hypothetical protein
MSTGIFKKRALPRSAWSSVTVHCSIFNVSNPALAQQVRFRAWLRSLARGKFAVMELGAGTAVPTVRRTSEQLAAAGRAPLIRINPRDAEGPPGALVLADGARAVLHALAALVT